MSKEVFKILRLVSSFFVLVPLIVSIIRFMRLTDSNTIKISFQDSLRHSVPKEDEVHIYRIVQELITNTLKHARASNIQITLECIDQVFILSYSDDGVGFKASELNRKKGIGLKNIERRVSILLGEIHFVKKEAGNVIRVEMPIINQ
jgi:signal transduction histidine kinase